MEDANKVLGSIIWKVLFGEDLETTPDPNKKENTARFNAIKRANKESLKRFAEGPGKVLFNQLRAEVRSGVHNLMTYPGNECICDIRKTLHLKLKLIGDVQSIINEKEIK